MTDIISIETADFGGEQVQCTTASILYDFLGLSKGQFARWCKKNILKNEFAFEGTDWVGFDMMSSGNLTRDYYLTIDFAKRLSMMARTEKGEQARLYFLKMESIVKVQKPLTQLEIVIQSAQILGEQNRKLEEHDNRILLLESKAMTSNVEFFAVSGYAHNIGKKITGLEAQAFGKKATALSKELGYKMGRVPDAKWGHVGTYHTDILSQIIK